MKDKLQRQIERLTRAHKRHSRWQRLVAVLAGVVALCTLGVLMMPAVAMEGEPHCGKVEHTHTDACYTQVLTCGQEEGDSHTHTEACYTRELTCGLAEHTHTDACYQDAAESTATPEPETTAEPTETPAATGEPEATAEPTATPEPTVTPVPSATPNQTEGQEDDNGDNADNATVFAVEKAEDGVIANGNCGVNGTANVTWTLTSDGTLTIRGKGATADYGGGNSPWYSNRSQILQVVVEDGVTKLGNYLFYECRNIGQVTLPNSVIGIGRYTFSYCTGLTKLTLPDTLESIGAGAFYGCTSLTEMNLPNSVVNIEGAVFCSCTNLESVTLSKKMTVLGDNFFAGCSKLTHVEIPNSVTKIGKEAFYRCAVKEVVIPHGVTSIGDYTFYNSGLQTITLPEGLTTIGRRAFSECTELKELTLPDTVQTLGEEAFYNCSHLQTIKLSSSLTKIPKNAFYGNSNLTAITIPAGVTEIGEWAFYNCGGLSEITLPESLREIGREAFYNHSAKQITIPVGVTTIGYNAFYTYKQIEYLSVPYTVTSANYFPYSDHFVWDANIDLSFYGGKKNEENKLTIGNHVTRISRGTMENIVALAAQDLTFDSHWIHLEKNSALKVPLNTLPEGDYYIDTDGVIYSWNSNKTAATLVYCPPHLTDYTIPAAVPASAGENAEKIPVTAVGSYAFAQAQKLTALQFAEIEKIDTIADFAFARALCLASINGETTETDINALFTESASLGLLPYQNTLITGAAENAPTTDGFTAELKENGNPTFQLSVKTNESSIYKPAIDDGVKQFYTDEKATMSVTLTNPGSYEVSDDGSYVARIYMQFDKDGFVPQYGVGTHTFVAHKSTEPGKDGGTYKLNVSKVGENIYCYEFQRPINGDTYTVDVTLSYPAITTGGGSCMLWGAITQKATATNKLQTREEYEKLRWFSCPDTYTYTMTASQTRHDDTNYTGVLSAGKGKGRVMLSFDAKKTRTVNRPAIGNVGEEGVKYIDFTTTVLLPLGTTLSDEAQAALQAGTAIRGFAAYTAGGTRFAYIDSSGEREFLSIKYDATTRTVTANYRQKSLSGDPKFQLQVILEKPKKGDYYPVEAETRETVCYSFSKPQEIGPQQARVRFGVGDPNLDVFYNVVEKIDNTHRGVAGNSYTFQIFAANKFPIEYTKMGMLRDEIGKNRYLTPESLAAIFGKPQASSFTPVLTITNATLCKTAAAKSVKMYDGETVGTTSTQYTSADAKGKYSAPISSTDLTQITNNATITMQAVNNQLQISWQYGSVSETKFCKIDAEAIRNALEHLTVDASYIVTRDCKYTLNWWNPQGEGHTATVPGGEAIMVAEYKVTIKTPLMCTYGSDLANKVKTAGTEFESYTQSKVTACDKNGAAYQENYGTGYVGSSFELRCDSMAEINTQYKYVKGGNDDTGRPQEESILEHVTNFSIDGKVDSTVPLVELTKGAQILLAEASKNAALAAANPDLQTYKYEEKSYYLLDQATTYRGVWLSGADGAALYADTVTVTGGAGNRTYDIRVYIPKGSNNTSLRLKYLTLVRTEGTPKFEESGTAWGGDHQARRITSFYDGEWLNYVLEKEIVTSATATAEGKKASAVAPGDKVVYRIRMAAYDGLKGSITLKGSQIRDILPKSLDGVFSWTEKNVEISYDTTADSNCKIENGDRWSITPDAEDANQQILTWGNAFSITFTAKPVYIYVTLTYPSTYAEWDAYSNAYASESLTNTVETLGMSSSVTHSLKIPAKAVIQQGVINSYQIIGKKNDSDAWINTANADARRIYSTKSGNGSVVQYYIAIKNDGKTRLYLTDLQCVLPQGFTVRSTYSSYDYTNSGYATDLKENSTESSISVRYSVTNEGFNQEGRQRFRISFIANSNIAKDHYDVARGMYFLNPKETVQLTYSCDVGTWDKTKDAASSTVVMPYYNVGNAGVQLGETRFEYKRKVNPNDDQSPTINDNTWASANAFDTAGWEEDSQWLTSTVTMHRGKAELGLEKKLTSTESSPDKRPSSATNTEKLNWSIVAKNSGSTAVEDYVISDTMDAPYQFVSGALELWKDDYKNNYHGVKGMYASMIVTPITFDAATKTVKCGDIVLPNNRTATEFTGYLYSKLGSENSKYVTYEVSYIWAENAAAPTISFRFKDPAIAIVPHGQVKLYLSTKKPEGSTNFNQTYVNTAWMTPLKEGVWDETATIGMLDKTLQTGYWDDPKTSIRSSANVVVSFGYSTSSTLEVSQTYDGNTFAASSDAVSTTILPDKNENIRYTMTVDNTVYQVNSSELTKLVLINNLPQPDDHNTFQDGDLRGSEYQIDLAENPNFKVTVTVIDPDTKQETENELQSGQYRIEYTTETSFNKDDWSGKQNNAKWTNNPTDARSFRIVIDDITGKTMPKHSKITVEYDAKVHDAASVQPGQIANNSFGYHYEVKVENADSSIPLEAAPMGVGLRTPYVPTLQKQLETPDEEPMTAAAKTTFRFAIYSGNELQLSDEFTEADLAKALKGCKFTVAEATVPAGQSASEAPWLDGLKQYSSDGAALTATEKAWEWKDGTIYRIIELPVTGDYRYGSINRSTARSYSFTYNYTNKNTLQCVNIGTSWAAKLTKIDAESGAPLADAYFALYSSAPADQMAESDYDALTVTKKPGLTYKDENGTIWYLKSVDTTGTDGTLTWKGLSESKYLYVEVQAPNGYNLDSTVHNVPRPTGGGTAFVRVTNRPGYNLPETGGIGTWPFMAAGLLLTGTALALLLKKRKTNN